MIDVQHLTKRYGRLTAVDDLSFSVAAGEAVALWGANGAGKTTVLHCLLHLTPFAGQVTVDGLDVTRQGKAARRLIGFVPQALGFHDDMTVAETLRFYAGLKKVAAGTDLMPHLERLALTRTLSQRVGALSGGLKQRLALALALLSEPPLLLLDEPTANLDIGAREDFLALLQGLRQAGKTLIFSSHRLDEVMALADRVLLLESGRLVVDAPPAELSRQLGRVSTLHLVLPEGGIDPALETLSAQGLPVSRNGCGVRVQVAAGQRIEVLRLLQEAGIGVTDFHLE